MKGQSKNPGACHDRYDHARGKISLVPVQASATDETAASDSAVNGAAEAVPAQV